VSPFDPQWERDSPPGVDYKDEIWAAALTATDPAGLGGISVRAWSGPLRETYVRRLGGLFPADARLKKMPLGISDDRLLGGLDISATLQAGRPVFCAGLLAEVQGGVLVLAMAERISASTAAQLAAAMDGGGCTAMVALDEAGGPDEAPPAALLERLAFTVTALPEAESLWPAREQIAAAQAGLAGIATGEETLEQLCAIAAMLGIFSLRAPLFALRAARAAAALRGSAAIAELDIALAARLVLAPRATRMPTAPDAPAPQDAPEPQEQNPGTGEEVEESVAAAAQALLPPALLAALAAGNGPKRMARGAGKSGGSASMKRGRPAGVRRGAMGGHARLSLIETLRAAAPWQTLRRRAAPARKFIIRQDDFRIKRFKEAPRSIAIFAVDASGSSAVNRLAEAKGAIQLLLADCYVRRDQVALLAFRGREAEVLLPPTHALARARRALSGLPGGGPTPLATGICAARLLAEAERRKGHKPLLVLLTDGGANIARDGAPGRAAAGRDALAAGRQCRDSNLSALVVDTAPRPQAFVAQLAAEMGGRYLPLPYADAARLSRAVQAAA
jgi:magnesium chelatase subunit D